MPIVMRTRPMKRVKVADTEMPNEPPMVILKEHDGRSGRCRDLHGDC